MDLGCRKKRGVSSDTTDCSSFLLTERIGVRKKRRRMMGQRSL